MGADVIASGSRQRVGLIVPRADRLRAEYIASRDGITPAMIAGTEQPPKDWINHRLQELGAGFRVP